MNMAAISDYLRWRGDLTFDKAPFNEVDNYIISKIGCPDFAGIVPPDLGHISLSAAVNLYFQINGSEGRPLGVLASEEIHKTLKLLPELPRYRNLRLSGFRRCTDIGATKQFSALTIALPDGTHYISFRGTDDSIVGWKENFMMTIMETIPAQEDALAYLQWAASVFPGMLIVGGHSKGGNLAFFAASRVSPEIQDRIIAIYNNDGPGFNQTFYENPGYKRILDRTHHIIPQHSVVGTLLTPPGDFEIVKCENVGVGSHDGFKWEVERDHFVRVDGLSRFGRSFDDALERTLASMTKEQTIEFIEQLFNVLSTGGAKNLTDLTGQNVFGVLSTLKSLRKETKVYAFLFEVAELTLSEMRKGTNAPEKRKKTRE